MSKDWIDKIAVGIAEREARETIEQQLMLQNAALIKSEAPRIWRALVEMIAEDVAMFNLHFPGSDQRQVQISKDPVSLRIELRNRNFPQNRVTLALNLIAMAIEIETFKTLDIFARAVAAPSARITFKVEATNAVTPILNGMVGYSIERMSELILTPLFNEVV